MILFWKYLLQVFGFEGKKYSKSLFQGEIDYNITNLLEDLGQFCLIGLF
jgi:hypothetical protein